MAGSLDLTELRTGLWLTPASGLILSELRPGLWLNPIAGLVTSELRVGLWLNPVAGLVAPELRSGLWLAPIEGFVASELRIGFWVKYRPPPEQFIPPVNPDDKLPVKVRFNTIKQQYGDNYAARASIGIRNGPREYPFKWSGLTKAEANYILDFLKSKKGGVPFSYVPIGEEDLRYFVCENYDFKLYNKSQYDITATFIETAYA